MIWCNLLWNLGLTIVVVLLSVKCSPWWLLLLALLKGIDER